MSVGLPEALERAASALPADADAIRPANGDPARLLELLDAEAAARVLRWLLTNEPADGAELASAWAEDPEAGVAALLRVKEERLPKAGRKALHRAHHRLRSRGVELPEAEPAKLVATLPPVEERLDEALLSSLDPRGACVAYLATSHPSGGVRLFELMLDEGRGVLECHVYDTGRSKARRFLRDFKQREGFTAVPAPPVAVRALVRRIAAQQPSDRHLPRGFSEWHSHLADAPEGAPTPGGLAVAELGSEPEPVALRRAAELVSGAEAGPWPPAPEVLQPLAERLGEVTRGAVIVSEAQRRERAEQVLEDGLEEIFAEPFSSHTAARFEETAYVFWKRDREDDARACLAAAAAFRVGSAKENPVAKAMVEVVLAPALQKLEEEIQEDEQKSRIVTP
jgi:hypothetical protein